MKNKDFQNGYILGVASGGVVEVVDTTEMDALESLIDNSGVLDSTEGSVSEKVEQLIEFAEFKPILQNALDTGGDSVFFNCQMTDEQVALFDFSKAPALNNMFNNNKLLTSVNLDTPNIKSMIFSFRQCNNLKTIRISDTSKVTTWNAPFSSGLIEVIETISFESCTATLINYFDNLSHLKTLKIVPETVKKSIAFTKCSKLTAESIQSIIDGLATVSTAQTLTLHSAIVLTDEQKATINAKGWTLAQ